jgi:hypothetical protein
MPDSGKRSPTASPICAPTGQPGGQPENQRLQQPARRAARLAYSLERLGKVSDLSVKLLYLEIGAGRLIARKVGRRTVVLQCDAINWLKALPLLGDDQNR